MIQLALGSHDWLLFYIFFTFIFFNKKITLHSPLIKTTTKHNHKQHVSSESDKKLKKCVPPQSQSQFQSRVFVDWVASDRYTDTPTALR